jgi:uncharacterized protein YyaL (SSP411 family)
MAHESFENEAIAEVMNAHFVNIKVDREERPDIDTIYMSALHELGEQGGWPLTMFLTPDREPFWGGTYFPPESRYGRPSFTRVLQELSRIWREERQKVTANSTALLAALKQPAPQAGDSKLSLDVVKHAASVIANAVDPVHGGLRGAPKFPQGPIFNFLWAAGQRAPVLKTLERISLGGIYDHLGGGIARYSVDAIWLVPHFEKMLYDNAQYVSLLSRAWLVTGSGLFRQCTEETVEFLLRDMVTAGGAFASSYDADSEGEEGRFYVWNKSEIERSLPEAEAFCAAYGVTAEGNWEGHTILNRLHESATPAAHVEDRRTLFERRERRPKPGFDDKVLADWNGLAIQALAEAALAFGRADWRDVAIVAFDRVLELLTHPDGLRHSYRDGKAQHATTSEGYANLIGAALALHRVADAEALLADMNRLYWDDAAKRYAFTSSAVTDLIVRTADANDNATPNANGVMVSNLVRLGHMTGNEAHRQRAERVLRTFGGQALQNPFASPSLLKGFLLFDDAVQLVDTGSGLLSQAIKRSGLDCVILQLSDGASLPDSHPAAGKTGRKALYVCRGHTCAAPASTEAELVRAFETLGL